MATDQMNSILHHLRRAAFLQDGAGLSDGQLLERFRVRREELAFEVLLRRHGPMVLGVCRRVLQNAHDAEDAFQATFLVLVRKAASLQSRETVGNWLYGVAYHTALKARAARLRRRTKEAQVKTMSVRDALSEDAWQDLQPLLDQELSRLPDKYREPVVLCELQGKTLKEAAQQLRVPVGTLSGRLTTARRLLAKRLTRHGVALSAGSLATVLPSTATSMPTPLVISTVKAAASLASGEAAAAVISAQVAALTEGVLKAMLMSKLKVTGVVLLVIGGMVIGGAALLPRSLAATGADQPALGAEQPPAAQPEARAQVREPKDQPRGGSSVAGTLLAVDANKHTITVSTFNRQTGKKDMTYELVKDIEVLRDGKPAKLGELKQGNRITVRVNPDQKTAVSICETGKTLAAPLKSVDAEKNTITVTVTMGKRGDVPEKKDVTYELAKDGTVTLAGKEAKLADLKDYRPGSTVQLTFSVDDEKKLVHIDYASRNR
jgi:RNA polymerase sigma factor (sigma-70 family)